MDAAPPASTLSNDLGAAGRLSGLLHKMAACVAASEARGAACVVLRSPLCAATATQRLANEPQILACRFSDKYISPRWLLQGHTVPVVLPACSCRSTALPLFLFLFLSLSLSFSTDWGLGLLHVLHVDLVGCVYWMFSCICVF